MLEPYLSIYSVFKKINWFRFLLEVTNCKSYYKLVDLKRLDEVHFISILFVIEAQTIPSLATISCCIDILGYTVYYFNIWFQILFYFRKFFLYLFFSLALFFFFIFSEISIIGMLDLLSLSLIFATFSQILFNVFISF